jgi:hypothetical protein
MSAALVRSTPDKTAVAKAVSKIDTFHTTTAVHRDPSWIPMSRRGWSAMNVFFHDTHPWQTEWSGRELDVYFFRSWVIPVRQLPKSLWQLIQFRHVVFRSELLCVQSTIRETNGQVNLWLAGMYTIGADFHESAVRSAIAVVQRLAPTFPNCRCSVKQYRRGDGQNCEWRLSLTIETINYRLMTGIVLFVLSTIAAVGCGEVNKLLHFGNAAVQQATDAIDSAVGTLNYQSSSWQQVLQQMESKLDSDAKNLIDNDVQKLISRTVDHAGVEFRCNADFVNHRVAEDLLVIKAKLLKQTPPTPQPQFCQAEPEVIDSSQAPDILTYYGYNFDLTNQLTVKLVSSAGIESDISSTVHVPTAYALTVTLVGLDLSSSKGLNLYWRGKPTQSVAIVSPLAPVKVCAQSSVDKPPQTIGPYIPPKVANGGDDEFNGNGPNIDIAVNLITTLQQVKARVYMNAIETRSDFTQVQGYQDFIIYTAPDNMRVDHVSGATSSRYQYTDKGYSMDKPYIIKMGSGDLVDKYEVIGDEGGNDVGHTGVAAVHLNPITIVQNEFGDCISQPALTKAIKANLISTRVQNSISPVMLKSLSSRVH